MAFSDKSKPLRRSRAGDYTPTRGPFAGQTFHSEFEYRKIAKDYSEEARRLRAEEKYGTRSKTLVTRIREAVKATNWPVARVRELYELRSPAQAAAHLAKIAQARRNQARGLPSIEKATWLGQFDSGDGDEELPDEMFYYHDE